MFVYHATYDIKWEAPRDLGLFETQVAAKKACQDDADTYHDGIKLEWQHHPTSETAWVYSDEFYDVTIRPVRSE